MFLIFLSISSSSQMMWIIDALGCFVNYIIVVFQMKMGRITARIFSFNKRLRRVIEMRKEYNYLSISMTYKMI